jgi:hypothetical membrane protein
VKFLYCPRCKDVKVKNWYQIKDKCPVCFSDATPIKVPNTWKTYMLYVLYVVAPAMLLMYVWNDDKRYLYAAFVVVFVMMAITWVELGRGRAYARAKVKITAQNSDQFRKRGWT